MDTQEQEHTLPIPLKRILYILAGLWLFVIVCGVAGQYLRQFPNLLNLLYPAFVHDFVVEFNVNAEANITTFYSVSLLSAASLLLFIIARLKNNTGDKYRFHWAALAWVVLYISVDDASVIHEKSSKYLQGLSDMGGWFEYRWVIVGIAVLVVLAVSFFQFWLSMDHKFKILFLVSAGVYFGGALGIELIGGRWAYSFGSKNFIYTVFTVLEQGLQYIGATLLLYSILLYVRSYYPRFAVSAKSSTTAAEQNVPIQPMRALYIFGGTAVGLVVLAVIAHYLTQFPTSYSFHIPFRQYLLTDYALEFNVREDANLVTYYNTLLLGIASFLLFVIARLKNNDKDAYRRYWSALAWTFFLLSIDNFSGLHEKVSKYFQDWTIVGGAWYEYRWGIAAAAAALILIALFFRFWRHLDRKYAALFLASIFLFFVGAAGTETIINGYWKGFLVSKGFNYYLFATLGEGLQYVAAALLIHALLHYLQSCYPLFYVSMEDKT